MNKEFLLGLNFREKEVTIEGEKFLVKEMNAKLAQEYESSLYKITGDNVKFDTSKAKTKLVLLTLHNMDGTRTFEDKDFSIVENLPSHIIELIYDVASNLNNLDEGKAEKN